MCNQLIYGTGSRGLRYHALPKPVHPRLAAACAEQPQRSQQSHRKSMGQEKQQHYSNEGTSPSDSTSGKSRTQRRAGRVDPAIRPGERAQRQRQRASADAPKDSQILYKTYTKEITKCKDLSSLLDVILSRGRKFNYVNTASALVRHTVACFSGAIPSGSVTFFARIPRTLVTINVVCQYHVAMFLQYLVLYSVDMCC